MNRERTAWIVSTILIAVLALRLPGSLAQREDDYAFVRTLVDIHRQVASNYVEPVDEVQLRQGAVDGLMRQLDPFSVYVPPAEQEEFDRMLEGSFKGVGIQLNQRDDGRIEVVTPIDGSPAFQAGVQAGDIILKVNGESVEGLRLPEVIEKVAGPLGSEVTLTVRHVTGEEADLTMTRQEIVVPTIKGYGRKEDNSWDYFISENPKVAYMRITQFTPDTTGNLRAAIEQALAEGMKGLILDLRWNPGGRLDEAVQMIDMFIEKGVIVSTRGRNRPERVQQATVPGTLPEFPLIVLVNEHSASAAEVVSGALLDNRRAVVLGTRTYGKGSVQEVVPLSPGEGELKLTVAYYYLPSGRLVHRKKDAVDWGVQPQIVVPMDAVTQREVMRQRFEQELFRRPVVKTDPTTMPAPTTQPTTQPIDLQLQQALNTMIALVVFDSDRRSITAPGEAVEVTSPTTRPAVEPASPTTQGLGDD